MGEAIRRGLELLRERKDMYREAGLQYFRPWVFLVSDGEPTDQFDEAARLARQQDAGRPVVLRRRRRTRQPPEAGRDRPPGRPPLKLKGLQFAELFLWLSQSQQRVSHSRVGDQLALPPVGWSEVAS